MPCFHHPGSLNIKKGERVMKQVRNFFIDKDGCVSWRKIMTCGALISFMTAVIGFLINNDFKELPASYMVTIDGVFLFYFGKNVVNSINKTSEPK